MRKNLHLLLAATAAATFMFLEQAQAQNTSPYWSLAGNSNASNTTSKLGTTNAINLRLFTNNAERMRITSSGLVGIGTTSPASRLTVNSASGQSPLRANIAGTTKLLVSSNGGLSVGSGSTPPANGLYVNGNVGIGTTAPFRKLQIANGDVRLQTGTTDQRYLEFVKTAADNTDWRFEHSIGGGVFYLSYSKDDFSSFTDLAYFTTAAPGSGGTSFVHLGDAIGYSWTLLSDHKLKNNISDLTAATSLIAKLQPKTYHFKQGEYTNLQLPSKKQYGFIAQELEQVLPELVTTSKIPVNMNPDGQRQMEDIRSVNYIALIPLLTKGFQEQQQQIERQQQENKELKTRITRLEEMLNKLSIGQTTTVTGIGMLGQNSPNPVETSTRISYSVPEGAGRAQLLLSDALGRTIKVMQLSRSGTLNLDASALSSGVYNYSLLVDGKTLETRKMTVVR